MRNILFLAALLIQVAYAQVIIKECNFPESAAIRGEYVYVSNFGAALNPMVEDGDGYISKFDKSGKLLEKNFLPSGSDKLSAPKGIAILGNTLFVADINKLWGFDLETRKLKYTFSFAKEGTQFLNDVLAFNDSTLLVSATDISKIYRVDLRTQKVEALNINGLNCPNGLVFEPTTQMVFVAEWGMGGQANGGLCMFNLSSPTTTFKRLGTYKGSLDGIALLGKGKLLFSDWNGEGKGGVLKTIDITTQKVGTLQLKTTTLNGPADFILDYNTLWLPCLSGNNIVVETLQQ